MLRPTAFVSQKTAHAEFLWNLSLTRVSKSGQAGGMLMSESKGAKPFINVTPLIDVLLVMLIIFMVAAPLKPHRFLTKLPAPPLNRPDLQAHPDTLVVTIQPDRTLMLNSLTDMGSVDNMTPLTAKLAAVFEERTKNRVYNSDLLARFDLPE